VSYNQPTGNGLCVGHHRHEPERPRKALDGGYLCGGCIYRLDRTLAEVAELVEDLERALIRAGSDGVKVSGDPERALPYNDQAGDARRVLLDVLGSWTRLIAEESGHAMPTDLSPAGQADWHRWHLSVGWLPARLWIDEYATNLAQASGAGRAALAGQRTKTVPLGACPDTDRCDVLTRSGLPCRGTLLAVIDLSDEMLPATVTCNACGHEHAARDLPNLGKRLTGGHAWLTTAQVALLLSLSQRRVREIAEAQGWRRRDGDRVRPSRWHADDVDQTRRGKERLDNTA
jgi:hypothetical protein